MSKFDENMCLSKNIILIVALFPIKNDNYFIKKTNFSKQKKRARFARVKAKNLDYYLSISVVLSFLTFSFRLRKNFFKNPLSLLYTSSTVFKHLR